jgi:alpha-N-acetylglucosamine transferase
MFRIPANCAHTTQHSDPELAQRIGPPPTAGLGMPNGGLQVVNPSRALYDKIMQALQESSNVANYEFADQSLLADVFEGRWVGLSYTYNALKFMRWPEIHGSIWRDEEVRNIHYLLSPKPWDETPGEESDNTHKWWRKANKERLAAEKGTGIDDGF